MDKKKPFSYPGKKPDEGKASAVPMLKYGKGNNFYKFKNALAEAALKEYCNLGKLIEAEKYYVPTLVLPDYNVMGISLVNVTFIAMKELAKEVRKMNRYTKTLWAIQAAHEHRE